MVARLLERTKHVKVWISFAQFESAVGEIGRARQVFVDAQAHFKAGGTELKEERVLLLESWCVRGSTFVGSWKKTVDAGAHVCLT
eukprot:COSAG01_NODE_6446_length_3661_cov_48.411286_2_plen_85_part_00